MIVVMQPVIQIKLQLLNCPVYLAPERHLVELLQDRFVKTFADAVGLWMIGFGPGMLDFIERKVELVIMSLWLTAILGAAIRQNTDQAHALLGEEG